MVLVFYSKVVIFKISFIVLITGCILIRSSMQFNEKNFSRNDLNLDECSIDLLRIGKDASISNKIWINNSVC